MKRLLTITLITFISFFAFSSQKSKDVARVKIKRGMATFVAPDGTKGELKKDMWVKEGAIIKTGEKSFVKLSFIDKSSMNVGPKSELKIEKFSKDDAGVINVLTGKIRSKVTKDYLKMDKNKSKLFVRSKSAVMGIRGTEFMFTANHKAGTATAVLFEGSVVFNKINKGDNLRNLESIVNKGRPIKPGQFSVAMRGKKKATIASKLSSKQFKKLEKNKNFKEARGALKKKKMKSVVPPGLAGDIVMGGSENLEKELKKVVKVKVKSKKKAKMDAKEKSNIVEETKAFVKGDDIKPTDGSFVDIDTGVIIPIGKDSVFDSNSGEWVSSTAGSIDAAGNYVPPEGFQMTDEGKMIVAAEVIAASKNDTVVDEVSVNDNDKKGDDHSPAILEIDLSIKDFDDTADLANLPTSEYVAPVESGPAPAGSHEPNPDAFAPEGENGIAPGDEEQNHDETAAHQGPAPAGEMDDDYLPRPPRPGDSSTANQPDSYNTGNTATPPSTYTNVRVQVNKQ